MAQGGIRLLSTTAGNAGDPQTLRMVAGAIANLCGNGKNTMPDFHLSCWNCYLLFFHYLQSWFSINMIVNVKMAGHTYLFWEYA